MILSAFSPLVLLSMYFIPFSFLSLSFRTLADLSTCTFLCFITAFLSFLDCLSASTCFGLSVLTLESVTAILSRHRSFCSFRSVCRRPPTNISKDKRPRFTTVLSFIHSSSHPIEDEATKHPPKAVHLLFLFVYDIELFFLLSPFSWSFPSISVLAVVAFIRPFTRPSTPPTPPSDTRTSPSFLFVLRKQRIHLFIHPSIIIPRRLVTPSASHSQYTVAFLLFSFAFALAFSFFCPFLYTFGAPSNPSSVTRHAVLFFAIFSRL
ncbi:unnamed protein product [Cyclocybe aegerita]|uniref:Uncharacterized protein n=1 Tax=Cyclocybe aegerita TaxID=1973307 RepID=A0A8S0WL80_CYCAE|nr:unnamed protein product [Cyclocybe aegerita]